MTDVRLPDGTTVTNVPDGITQSELTARLQKANHPAAASLTPAPKEPGLPPTGAGGQVVGQAAPQPAKQPNLLSKVGQGYAGGVADSWQKLKSDYLASSPDKTKFAKAGFWDQQKQHFDSLVSSGKVPLDAFNTALSLTGIPQAVGAVTGAAGRGVSDVLPAIPGSKNFGSKQKIASSFADTLNTGLALAAPGVVKKPGVAAEAAEAAPKVAQEARAAPLTPKPEVAPVGATPKPPPPQQRPMPQEGPLSKPPALTQPRTFEDQLFQLEQNRIWDKQNIMKAISDLPDVKPETAEKLYHYEENPEGVKLTPEEQSLYDEHVAPVTAESNQLHKDLEGYGYNLEDKPTDKGHTPRYVAGKTRSFGEMLAKWKEGVETRFQGGAAAKSMRQTVDAQKSRRFYNAVSPDGEKVVVHVGKDGTVLGFNGTDEPSAFGTFPRGQKVGEGSKVRANGETWRLEQATTKEIENVAATRYHKNIFANRYDNLAKLRSAVRNAKFINDAKELPEWSSVAVKTTEVSEPPVTNGQTWKTTKMPQFHGYYMEPQLAEALDDAAGRQHDLDGVMTGLDKAGKLVKGSIFWNPFPHDRNLAEMYLVDKGLVGTAASVVSGVAKMAFKGEFPALLKAARSVINQDKTLERIGRAGLNLPYTRVITQDLHKALTIKLGGEVAKNPSQWAPIAKAFGYANPIDWVKGLYKISNKGLWEFGDILATARVMDRMDKGAGLEDAIKQTKKTMPSYRVPGRVMGSRTVAQIFSNPLLSMFGRYQYNRLAAFANMAQDMVGKGVPLKQRAQALDKLAMLGVLLFVYRPVIDKLWQHVTGNENAKTTRPGLEAVPQAGLDLASGRKNPSQAASSIFSAGVAEIPFEALTGDYAWSGKPIAYPQNLTDGHPDQFARDLGTYMASKISPVGQTVRILGGDQTPEQFFLSQIGVQTPTDQQVNTKEKYKRKDATYALRRAGRLQGQRASQGEKQ